VICKGWPLASHSQFMTCVPGICPHKPLDMASGQWTCSSGHGQSSEVTRSNQL